MQAPLFSGLMELHVLSQLRMKAIAQLWLLLEMVL
jgi:hypothetical protein